MAKNMVYAAFWNGHCQAMCIDNPDWKKDVAKDVAAWMRQGATIRRMSAEKASGLMKKWLEIRDKQSQTRESDNG